MNLWYKDPFTVMEKVHGDVSMNDSWPVKHIFINFGPFGGVSGDFSLF